MSTFEKDGKNEEQKTLNSSPSEGVSVTLEPKKDEEVKIPLLTVNADDTTDKDGSNIQDDKETSTDSVVGASSDITEEQTSENTDALEVKNDLKNDEKSDEKELEKIDETSEDEQIQESQLRTEDVKKEVEKNINAFKKVFSDVDEASLPKASDKNAPIEIKEQKNQSNVDETPSEKDEKKSADVQSTKGINMSQLPEEVQKYFKDVNIEAPGKVVPSKGKNKEKWTTTIIENVSAAATATIRASRHIEIISWCMVVICALHVGIYATKMVFLDQQVKAELWNTIIMTIMTLAWANNSGRLPTSKNSSIKNRINDMKKRLTNT